MKGCISCKHSECTYTYAEWCERMLIDCRKQDKVLPEVMAGCEHFEGRPARDIFDKIALGLQDERAEMRATDEELEKEVSSK